MSTVSYKRNTRVYYITFWSIEKNGIRKWVRCDTFSKTPDEALEETKERILYSKNPSFEMRLGGWKVV